MRCAQCERTSRSELEGDGTTEGAEASALTELMILFSGDLMLCARSIMISPLCKSFSAGSLVSTTSMYDFYMGGVSEHHRLRRKKTTKTKKN